MPTFASHSIKRVGVNKEPAFKATGSAVTGAGTRDTSPTGHAGYGDFVAMYTGSHPDQRDRAS